MENQNPQGAVPQPTNKEKNTAMAIIAYILFFIPLLTDAKNDPFVKYHVKQGIVLFIVSIAVTVLAWSPIIYMLSWPLHLAIFILFIIGVVNAAQGKEEPLPLIGQFADKINL